MVGKLSFIQYQKHSPTEMKKRIIILLYKEGKKAKDDPNSNRPITHLSAIL